MDNVKVENVLVVDDEQATAQFIARILKNMGYDVSVAYSFEEAIRRLSEKHFTLVISDLQLDHEDGTKLIPHLQENHHATAIIFITGFGSIDTAVRALQEGAFDYISKPADLADIEPELRKVVDRALRHRDTILYAKAEPELLAVAPSERKLVGRSPAMVRIYRMVAKAAMTRENVLLTGESGTGKELVAHAIHTKSPWADRPFVTVNCCALTETLLESELFGHVRGAFTGANQNKKGLFEEAHGGTLFLDEIGDVSLGLQVKLLRAIQEGEIKPVGANETRKVDVRVIAATHRNLHKFVSEGKFREDLYYRLKVILVEIPPLRDRPEDLPELINYFVDRASKKTGKPVTAVSEEALEFLMRYPWPGNIRELENAIGRAVAMTGTSILFPEDFPSEILMYGESMPIVPAVQKEAETTRKLIVETPEVVTSQQVPPEEWQSLEDLERSHIAKTLESVNFNKSKAAELLGIDRVTLYRKAFRYGIPLKRGGKPEATPAT